MLFWCKRVSRVLSRVLNTTEVRLERFLLRDCDLQVFEHPHVHVVGCLSHTLSFCTHARLLSLQTALLHESFGHLLVSLVYLSCFSWRPHAHMRNSWCITTVVLTNAFFKLLYMHLQEIVLLHE